MRKILPLVKITLKEHEITCAVLILFNLVLVVYGLFGAPAIDETSRGQLFYSISLESTFLLAFLLALFALSTSLPKDLKEKKVYSLFVSPLTPMDLLLGRILGSLALAGVQVGSVLVVLLVLGASAPGPRETRQALSASTVEIKGGLDKNQGGIYWAYTPKVRWELPTKLQNFPLVFPAPLIGDFPLYSPLWEILAPVLVFRNIEIPQKSALVEISAEVVGPHTQENPMEVHRKVLFHSQEEILVPLPLSFLYAKGKWRVSLSQEDLSKEISLPLNKATLALQVPYLYVPSSLGKYFYERIPFQMARSRGGVQKEKKLKLQGAHLIWHFHRLPPKEGKIRIDWNPLLAISNSTSRAQVALGASPDDVRQIREVEIRDNGSHILSFSSLGRGDVYFHIFWADSQNSLGADFSRDLSGRQKNGAVLLLEPHSRWWELGKVVALFFMKLLLVLSCLGVMAIFLSRYIVLFFGLAFYLGGHSVPQMREFSQMLRNPSVSQEQDHDHDHDHGVLEPVKSFSPEAPSVLKKGLSRVMGGFASVFPDLSRYDLLNNFLYSQYIPPGALWRGLYYLFWHCLIFFSLGLGLFFRKEYP